MERTPCNKCFGKGKAKIKNDQGFDIQVDCPVCGGSGYANIFGKHVYDEEFDEQEEIIEQSTNTNIQINETDKNKILNQIIKYPKLFTEGIYFPYNEENIEIFIYLKNNYIFDIEQTNDSMFIKLKNVYKNKLAEDVINTLKEQLK